MQRELFAAGMLAACALGEPASAAPDSVAGSLHARSTPLAFSGQLVRYHKAYPHQKHITQIALSPHGVSISTNPMFAPSRPGSFIQNFAEDKAWVVDAKKRIYAIMPSGKSIDEADMAEDTRFDVGGIMANEPCADAQEKTRTGQRGGKQTWRCQYGSTVLEQTFDTDWGVVMREEWPDATVSELRNLKSVNFTAQHFYPATTYLEVTLQEFFEGYAPLPDYESNALNSISTNAMAKEVPIQSKPISQ